MKSRGKKDENKENKPSLKRENTTKSSSTSEASETKRPKTEGTEQKHRNVLYMRTDNTKNIKTSVVVEASFFPNDVQTLKKAHASFTAPLDKIPTHRPAYEITKFSEKGSPLEVITPENKTKLKRSFKIEPITFFTDADHLIESSEESIKTELTDVEEFMLTPQYKALVKVLEEYKLIEAAITIDSLNETREQHIKNNRRRLISQSAAVSETGRASKDTSASAHAKATKLFSDEIRWEWLHLIAYMILGHASQKAANLVGGTAYANTSMMFLEAEMRYLAEKFPDGFKLIVKADLIPNTHIATKIYYTIKAEGFNYTFSFDAQQSVKPHITMRDYVRILIQTIVELAQATDNKNNKIMTPVTPSKVQLPFFQRPVSNSNKTESKIENSETKLTKK